MAQSIYFYSDSRELGGAELALLMLIEELMPRWDLTLLVDDLPTAGPLRERGEALGIAVEAVEPMPLGLAGARAAVGLARDLRRRGPTIFHAHLSAPLAAKWALAAAVAARVPSVATVQLIPEFELTRPSYWQLRVLAHGVGRYIAVSRALADELADSFDWPAEKIEVVYNAVRLNRFERAEEPLRKQPFETKERPIVLTCARLDEQKGHDVLLQAAATVPDAVFVVAGDGPLRPFLEQLARDLGIADRVRFLGFRRDVPELLAAADLFALPSLFEGSSLALLEAMAARRAVVTSAIAGTDEVVIDGESGLLVPPRDPTALGSALRRVLGDRTLRDSLAAAGRARVEAQFTPQVMSGEVERIYRELLGS